MAKELHEDEIPEELRGLSPAYYKCDICGCIFNDKQLAEECESKNMSEYLSRT